VNKIKNFIKAQYEKEDAWCISEDPNAFWLIMEKEIVSKYYPNKLGKVLDLGVGRGRYLDILEQKSDIMLALDISSKMLENVKKKYKNKKIYLVQGDCDCLPFKSETFELINAIQIIGHSENIRNFLDEVYRVLKRDGILIISTGNNLSIFNLFDRFRKIYKHIFFGKKSNLLKFFGNDRKFWLMYQGHCRDTFFSLKRNLERKKFKIISVEGVGILRPFTFRTIEKLINFWPFKYLGSLIILVCKKA